MTSTTRANKQTNSKRRAVVISVIAVVAAIALALGVGFGVRARQARAAAASRAKAVAAARADCGKSVDRLQSAIRLFKSTADGTNVKDALKLKAGQVADPKTVDELKQVSTVSVKPVSCSASTVSGLERASKVNDGRARSVSAQTARLSAAAAAALNEGR